MPGKDEKKTKKSNTAPRTKFEAEHRYTQEGTLLDTKPKPMPKKPKDESFVSKFGKYLKGKLSPEGIKAVDKYFAAHWKSKDLEKQIAEKKKMSEIKRLKRKGREMRKKK